MMKRGEDMSHILQTPEECLLHAKVMEGRGRHDLAAAAYRRAFHLMAVKSGVSTDVEREFWAGIYAYEHAKAKRLNLKSYRANRIHQMINRWGIKDTIERTVSRKGDSVGYRDLIALGLKDMSFEAVVLRHPKEFSDKAVAISKAVQAAH
jgi:hypothetical protein